MMDSVRVRMTLSRVLNTSVKGVNWNIMNGRTQSMKIELGLVVAMIMGLSACAGVNGVDGQPGLAGPQGESIVGPQGPAGAPGANGADAASVSVVQLCSGTTTYPSKFVEIGFCIGGRLYATYSANDGFSTEIVPGTYTSNGINSSCTFTVAANCVVTQN